MTSVRAPGPGAAASAASVRTVKSAERALRILEVLGAAREPMTVTALYKATEYPRSSLHQLLHTMADMRWIEFSGDASSVAVGSLALLVGTSYLDRDRALQHATRTLEQIRDRAGYTAHYARIEGTSVIYLATRETSESHRAASRVGRQLPAHATALGKALLAELSPAEVAAVLPDDDFVALTANTVTSMSALDEQLEVTRRRGYSLEHEENTIGVACVAVAVPYRIPATDAISCSIPLSHATDDELARVAAVISVHVESLAMLLRSEGIR